MLFPAPGCESQRVQESAEIGTSTPQTKEPPAAVEDTSSPRSITQDLTASKPKQAAAPSNAVEKTAADTAGGGDAIRDRELQELDLPSDLDFSRPVSLAQQRQERDETIWQDEVLAQQYEAALVRLWDALLVQQRKAAGDPYQVLFKQPVRQFIVGTPGIAAAIRWGATVATLNERPVALSEAEWRQRLQGLQHAGYEIVQTEWHHAQFDPPTDGPCAARITMAIYAIHSGRRERVVLSGDLRVVWQSERDAQGLPLPDTVDASELRLYRRTGEPGFAKLFTVDHAERRKPLRNSTGHRARFE